MKAPDKIYIPRTPDCEVLINDWSGIPLAHYDWKPVIENVEYIRKDALLDWAKEWAERYPYSHEFQMIIDKINSL